MNVIKVFIVILLVALFIISDSMVFGKRRRGFGQGTNQPNCLRRCPRPTRRSRVCALVEAVNETRTFKTACQAERLKCRLNGGITILSVGPCSRLTPRMAGSKKVESESESKEDSLESNEQKEITTVLAPVQTSPYTPPTTRGLPATTRETATDTTVDPTAATNSDVTSESAKPPSATERVASEAPSATTLPTPVTSDNLPGVTGPELPCNTSCPPVSSPVCGTDGATYPSVCVLEAYACTNGLDALEVAGVGPCVQ